MPKSVIARITKGKRAGAEYEYPSVQTARSMLKDEAFEIVSYGDQSPYEPPAPRAEAEAKDGPSKADAASARPEPKAKKG